MTQLEEWRIIRRYCESIGDLDLKDFLQAAATPQLAALLDTAEAEGRRVRSSEIDAAIRKALPVTVRYRIDFGELPLSEYEAERDALLQLYEACIRRGAPATAAEVDAIRTPRGGDLSGVVF